MQLHQPAADFDIWLACYSGFTKPRISVYMCFPQRLKTCYQRGSKFTEFCYSFQMHTLYCCSIGYSATRTRFHATADIVQLERPAIIEAAGKSRGEAGGAVPGDDPAPTVLVAVELYPHGAAPPLPPPRQLPTVRCGETQAVMRCTSR